MAVVKVVVAMGAEAEETADKTVAWMEGATRATGRRCANAVARCCLDGRGKSTHLHKGEWGGGVKRR